MAVVAVADRHGAEQHLFRRHVDKFASLSFTDVGPDARIVLGTLASFKSDVSGDFSATVPEPSTWAMMLLGFAGLGYVGFRKARARSAISIA